MKSYNGAILLVILIIAGAILYASFLFLADKETPIPPKVNVKEQKEIINSAKKERGALQPKADSVDKVIKTFKPQKQVNKEIDEKINRTTATATDVQLDSILTNYRYIPLSERTNR